MILYHKQCFLLCCWRRSAHHRCNIFLSNRFRQQCNCILLLLLLCLFRFFLFFGFNKNNIRIAFQHLFLYRNIESDFVISTFRTLHIHKAVMQSDYLLHHLISQFYGGYISQKILLLLEHGLLHLPHFTLTGVQNRNHTITYIPHNSFCHG